MRLLNGKQKPKERSHPEDGKRREARRVLHTVINLSPAERGAEAVCFIPLYFDARALLMSSLSSQPFPFPKTKNRLLLLPKKQLEPRK